MNSLLLLIPAALFLGLAGLAAFMWALRSGQFDDLEGAANRILFDDDTPEPPAIAPRRSAPDSASQSPEFTSQKEKPHVGHQ